MANSSYPLSNGFRKDISLEEAEVLKNPRRRGVIKALSPENTVLESLAGLFLEQDSAVGKNTVARQVASWETGEEIENVPDGKLESVKSTLHQSHIPMLDEHEIIDYSHENRVLRPLKEIEQYTGLVGERPYSGSAFPGVDDSGDDESFLTADIGFEMLSNERRREVLGYLDHHGSTDISELASYVAEKENPDSRVSSMDRKKAYVGLSQSHLPRLDEADIIDYDKDRKTVEKDRYFETINRYVSEDGQRPSMSPDGIKAFSFFPMF